MPLSVMGVQWLYRATQAKRWAPVGVLAPVTLISVTSALATVGGAMLLLPAAAGFVAAGVAVSIVPTAAATLLTVSVEPVPTPSWRVIRLHRSSVPIGQWRHSTYVNRAALDALAASVRESLVESQQVV